MLIVSTSEIDYQYWMREALKEAALSPDKDTQNAAVIVSHAGGEIARGRIDYSPGVERSEQRSSRPLKYMFLEHAERSAILTAAGRGRPLAGATMICPWASCADCARAIIQVGIHTLVRLQRETGFSHPRWEDSISAGDQMMIESGVKIIEIRLKDSTGLPALTRNQEPWNF